MKTTYYPGCTLKNKAKNLEISALAALDELGIEVTELERWNCCGAVASLADDNLLMHVAPARVLIRAKDEGSDRLMTLCSQCYNVLAKTNTLMRKDAEKRDTINMFMDEETDYFGEVEVVHYLQMLETDVGWEKLKGAVKRPLKNLKAAAYYGCALARPRNVALDVEKDLFSEFLEALGAIPVHFRGATECCGAYENLANPDAGLAQSGRVLQKALHAGAQALVLSCPLCDYNLGSKQEAVVANNSALKTLPVFYFTQLLAAALGLEEHALQLDLNMDESRSLLKETISAASPASSST